MRYALDAIGGRMEAAPGKPPATCPTCGSPVRAKTGQIVAWHWAHIRDASCDPWSEPDSEWHRGWQELAPPERREVVMPPHRADVVTSTGWVIELQHSSISPEEIREREDFYGPRMLWVFDAREAYEAARLRLRRRDGYYSFRWMHPRKSIAACRRPVVLDCGEVALRLRKIHIEAPCGGWGLLVDRSRIEALIAADAA
jgi:competence protein CoiA